MICIAILNINKTLMYFCSKRMDLMIQNILLLFFNKYFYYGVDSMECENFEFHSLNFLP